MINRANVLPLTRQVSLLRLSRSTVYYLPRPVPPARLATMHRIDALHLEHPFAGSRMLRDMLRREGITIGRLAVATLIEGAGREASPAAAVIDSQSVKTAESGGPRGYDAGKKIKGRKRHAMVDTDGRGLMLHAHPASVQERDGGPPLLRASRRRPAFVEICFADSGYGGERVAKASPIRVEIVRKPKGQVGCAVHARRWVVERFFAWINRNRRLAKVFEPSIASTEAFLYAAAVMLLPRRSARFE